MPTGLLRSKILKGGVADQASPTRRPQLDSWLCAIAQNMNADRSFAQQNTERRRGQLGVPIFIPGSGDDVKYDTRHG